MSMNFAIKRLVNTPTGILPVTIEHERIPLPGGPGEPVSRLLFGPYFNAICRFLSDNSHHALIKVLSKHLGRVISVDEIDRVELISEKHGTLYQVIRLRVYLGGQICSLAVNVSAYPQQHAFLENEFCLLQHLSNNFRSGFLPEPYLIGDSRYSDDRTDHLPLKLFIAEWFEDYHEFHLSTQSDQNLPIIRVWDANSDNSLLNLKQTHSLYRSASAILTSYLDGRTFQQIYPWHHAAGDFVVKARKDEVDLRLITVRDYRCLLSPGSHFENVRAAVVHFFLNATIRLRLDRFDGTGELAWAGPACLSGIIEGFLQAWTEKVQGYPHLPSDSDILDLLCSYDEEDWRFLAEAVMEDGRVEDDEMEFLKPLIANHAIALRKALLAKRFFACSVSE